jgi:hypothetical protein
MLSKLNCFILSCSLMLFSCANQASNAPAKQRSDNKPAPAAPAGNYLRMKIDGKTWEADHEIFGAFHPKGYNKAILIAGSKGPKDKNEQTFNLNLFNTSGPGVFDIQKGNPDLNVIQLGNMSPENFMYGSTMGFSVKVTVLKASANPTVMEARFEGELNGNTGDKISITEGAFYYQE